MTHTGPQFLRLYQLPQPQAGVEVHTFQTYYGGWEPWGWEEEQSGEEH
jgi:hypothetical protein